MFGCGAKEHWRRCSFREMRSKARTRESPRLVADELADDRHAGALECLRRIENAARVPPKRAGEVGLAELPGCGHAVEPGSVAARFERLLVAAGFAATAMRRRTTIGIRVPGSPGTVSSPRYPTSGSRLSSTAAATRTSTCSPGSSRTTSGSNAIAGRTSRPPEATSGDATRGAETVRPRPFSTTNAPTAAPPASLSSTIAGCARVSALSDVRSAGWVAVAAVRQTSPTVAVTARR